MSIQLSKQTNNEQSCRHPIVPPRDGIECALGSACVGDVLIDHQCERPGLNDRLKNSLRSRCWNVNNCATSTSIGLRHLSATSVAAFDQRGWSPPPLCLFPASSVRLAPGIGLPLFDSPSIFAAILDGRKGGFFKIESSAARGVGELADFMPVEDPSRGKKTHRILRAVRFRLECQPAFDYARRPDQVTLEGRGSAGCTTGTTATPASATRRLPSTPSCALG